MRRFFQSNITFVFVTVLFVMISAFCISQTVSGKEDAEAKEQEAFYREQENKLAISQDREQQTIADKLFSIGGVNYVNTVAQSDEIS